MALSSLGCSDTLDLCAPMKARLGFFSKGDCVVTRAGFFQGHEWLTWFGNRDLPERDRFTDDEIQTIVEGNRRVDWPLELLVQLNNGVVAYTLALTAYTERPEVQRHHFLLSDDDDTPHAFADSVGELRRLTRESLRLWPTERTRALTLMGRAQHLLQDSFSAAHAVREPENEEAPWCVRTIKAYIARKPGFDTPDIQYHGAHEGQTIGHTTPEDSVYRAGRDCHEPSTEGDVERCLSETATRARLGSRDYLEAMRGIVSEPVEAENVDRVADAGLAGFLHEHMELCP